MNAEEQERAMQLEYERDHYKQLCEHYEIQNANLRMRLGEAVAALNKIEQLAMQRLLQLSASNAAKVVSKAS